MRLLSSTLFFVLLFLTACIATAQKNNNLSSAYSITYKSTSYLYGKDKSPVKEYMRLMANDKISSFQAYNDMELDSLRKNGTMSQDSRNRFYANEKSTIEIRGNIVSYYEDILDNEYWYKETLNFKWNLLSDVKTINGYSCKKAKVNYGGRVWTAWYTTSIPLSTGPYKFKGLPGLIIKIYDEDSVFDYELTTIIEKPVIAVGKYFHSKPLNERIEMSHDEFNKFKKSYNALSLNEKLVLLNNQQEGKIKGVSISAAGTVNEEIGNRRSVIQPDMIEIIGDK
jgi:GLPGLI family protein